LYKTLLSNATPFCPSHIDTPRASSYIADPDEGRSDMDALDYRDLSGLPGAVSEIFLDFIDSFDRVGQYYPHDFRDPEAVPSVAQALSARTYDRGTLASVLREQNIAFGGSPATIRNIELLRRPETLAVVTGQQVGLFGGPLYSLYKVLTAVKLAAHLKSVHPQYNFVPVFWLEGEDHDFEEVHKVGVLDSESRLQSVEYLPGGSMPDRNPGPVGEIAFDETLGHTFDQLQVILGRTEFSEGVMTSLRRCYRPGATFGTAFACWMAYLLQDQGVVFLSAHAPALKRLLSPLIYRELEEFPRTSQLVISRSAELEKTYHAQIKPKSINLFMFHKGGRYPIEPREQDFSLKGTRHFLQKDEILRLALEQPELFSPNVVLRPLAQDTLLPTVVYVGGPAEIAYHAQLQPVYEAFELVQPVLIPRASATIVEERLRRVADKYGVSVVEFLLRPDQVTAKVLDQVADVKVDAIFKDTHGRLKDALNELRFGLRELDPTLLGALDGVTEKLSRNLDVLQGKATEAQKRRNEIALRQLDRATQALAPGRGLQERQLSALFYLNRYGTDFVRWLEGELDIKEFKHQLLYI